MFGENNPLRRNEYPFPELTLSHIRFCLKYQSSRLHFLSSCVFRLYYLVMAFVGESHMFLR